MIAYITVFLLVSQSVAQKTTESPELKKELQNHGESKCDALFESVGFEFCSIINILSKREFRSVNILIPFGYLYSTNTYKGLYLCLAILL